MVSLELPDVAEATTLLRAIQRELPGIVATTGSGDWYLFYDPEERTAWPGVGTTTGRTSRTSPTAGPHGIRSSGERAVVNDLLHHQCGRHPQDAGQPPELVVL